MTGHTLGEHTKLLEKHQKPLEPFQARLKQEEPADGR